MSSTEIDPRVIVPGSYVDDRTLCLTVAEYVDGFKAVHQALDLPVYDSMLKGADTLIGMRGSSPEVIAFAINELMDGDESKIGVLNWAYLAAYQRRWASMIHDDGLQVLNYADRFAAATDQTHLHSLVNGDYDGFEWSSDHNPSSVGTSHKGSSGYEQSHLSLISSCRLDLLMGEESPPAGSLRNTLVKSVADGANLSFRGVGASRA